MTLAGEDSAEFDECTAFPWCMATIQRTDIHFGPLSSMKHKQRHYFSPETQRLRAQCLLEGIQDDQNLRSNDTDKAKAAAETFQRWKNVNLLNVWATLHAEWALEEQQCADDYIQCTQTAFQGKTGNVNRGRRLVADSASVMPSCSFPELRRQVIVDVRRATNSYDCHFNLSDSERQEVQEQLSELVETVFASNFDGITRSSSDCSSCSPTAKSNGKHLTSDDPSQMETGQVIELQYLQGAHEICLIIVELLRRGVNLTGGNDAAVALCRNIIFQRLFAFHSNLSLAVTSYQLLAHISTLLKHFAPSKRYPQFGDEDVFHSDSVWNVYEDTFGNHAVSDGSELHFTLPWLITLFAHNITVLSTLIRLWNVLFAFPPPFLIYYVAVVASQNDGFMAVSSEMGSRDVIKSSEVFHFLKQALDWLERYPYAKLVHDVADMTSRWREVNSSSSSQWFETNESLLLQPEAESILPPLWTPILGNNSLAVPIDTITRVPSTSRRELNILALDQWAATIAVIDTWRRAAAKKRQRLPISPTAASIGGPMRFLGWLLPWSTSSSTQNATQPYQRLPMNSINSPHLVSGGLRQRRRVK